jgi:hypothetical protein
MTGNTTHHQTPVITAPRSFHKNPPSFNVDDERFIDYTEKLERQWQKDLRQSLPKTEAAWLEVFPEAQQFIPDTIRDLQSAATTSRAQVEAELHAIESIPDRASHWFSRAFLKYTFRPVRDLAFANKRIRSLKWLLPTQNQNRKAQWQNALNKARESDIVQVAEHYGLQLRKSGGTYKSLCPSHAERIPSFHLYPPSRFVCFGCDIKGDVIALVQLIEKCSFKDAVNKLQRV